MANKGEYRLIDKTPFQKVDSIRRTYGVMFNPSSSKSRLRIVDSGRRYEIRLNDKGFVEFSLDGQSWHIIKPCIEADSKINHPVFMSFNRFRSGEELKDIRFDMIAVGRGRVLAKQVGTDQFFHLVMDELFRTYKEHKWNLSPFNNIKDNEDLAVPGAYFKLDPEFFKTSSPTLIVPPELNQNYNNHPASLRFKVFSELLSLQNIDAIIVTQQPRIWHLIDPRSPLMISGPEDLKIDEEDFKDVFDRNRLEGVFLAFFENSKQQFLTAFYEIIQDAISDFWRNTGITGLSSTIRRTVRSIIGRSLMRIIDGISNFFGQIANAVAVWISNNILIPLADFLAEPIIKGVIKSLAKEAGSQIRAEGFGALILPANILSLYFLNKLREGEPGERPIDTKNNKLSMHPKKMFKVIETLSGPENKPLSHGIELLMRRARKRYYQEKYNIQDNSLLNPLAKVPNMPSLSVSHSHYIHTIYEQRNGTKKQKRYGIAFSKVLDIGVGYSHWSEHWQLNFGGEIHSLLATRPMAQQEQYNLLQYRFLNGPVIDGDAFNDGTCNFYILVKLKQNNSLFPKVPSKVDKESQHKQEYAILWIDEQTYFTQRWRLVHPTDDVLGDLFSVQRTLKDNPEWFQFNQNKFWQPFSQNLVNDNSRMLVKRQIIILTGFNEIEKQYEIYSICFNYGVSDYTWRWRLFPTRTKQILLDNKYLENPFDKLPKPSDEIANDINWTGLSYVNAIELRDDATIIVQGFLFDDINNRIPVQGRWFQKYLPYNFSQIPHRIHLKEGEKPEFGFSHEWDFFSEAAYKRADKFYSFGVYEEVDSRCQYYEIELLPLEGESFLNEQEITSSIWKNDINSDKNRLIHNTLNFDWSIKKDEDGYIPISSLIQNKSLSPSLSMYENTIRFRILKMKPLGLIAIFYDKRDDELQCASHLPKEIILTKDFIKVSPKHDVDCESEEKQPNDNIKEHNKNNKTIPGEYDCNTKDSIQIKVLVKSNIKANYPPIVRKAQLKKIINNGTPELIVSFWTPQNESEVYRNIWKVHIAALEHNSVIKIFEKEVFPDFKRMGMPDKPLTFQFGGQLDINYQYGFQWPLEQNDVLIIDKYCTASGRINYSTSIWFEDIVGHKSISQMTVFE